MRPVRNLAANIGGSTITIAAGVAFSPFYFIPLRPEAKAPIGFHATLTSVLAAMDTSLGHIIKHLSSHTRDKSTIVISLLRLSNVKND